MNEKLKLYVFLHLIEVGKTFVTHIREIYYFPAKEKSKETLKYGSEFYNL